MKSARSFFNLVLAQVSKLLEPLSTAVTYVNMFHNSDNLDDMAECTSKRHFWSLKTGADVIANWVSHQKNAA